MPAYTADDGENWADELNYKLWIPARQSYDNVSLDQARGKVITMTEVCPRSGGVIIYLKNIQDCSSLQCR